MADSESLTAPQDRPEPTPQWPKGRVNTRALWDDPLHPLAEQLVTEIKRLTGTQPFADLESWIVERAVVHALKLARDVAVPARAHHEEKEQEGVSRVDGERLSGGQELPRKPPTGCP